MQKIKFFDPGSGKHLCGEVRKSGYIDEQKWIDVLVDGVQWAVPVGWPNNCNPVCKESESEAYREIVASLEGLESGRE